MTQEEANEALLSAAEEGDVEALKSALAAGADVNGVGDNDDSMYCDATALIYAAEGGIYRLRRCLAGRWGRCGCPRL